MRARPIALDSGGLRLEGELVVPDDPRLAVVMCHGIPSGSPPDPADAGYAGLAREIAARGHAVLWFDFRGARNSPGEFSIAGWATDLDAALDALASDRETASLPRVAAGSSAGGGVAIVAGARRADVAAVAALAAPAFYRFDEYGGSPERVLLRFRHLGIVRDPAFPANLDDWWGEFEQDAPERHVAAVTPRPLLLVHGDADDVVPFHHAIRLFESAGEPKELAHLPGGGHQLRKDPRAVDALCDWLDGVASSRGL